MDRDHRGTHPPQEEPPEDAPGSEPKQGDEEHGPLGNPAVDEEALSHRQANREPDDDAPEDER
jgi:hypothetical protein